MRLLGSYGKYGGLSPAMLASKGQQLPAIGLSERSRQGARGAWRLKAAFECIYAPLLLQPRTQMSCSHPTDMQLTSKNE